MRRREFVAGLGGAALAWPLAARAQQRDGRRRIGVLMNLDSSQPEAQGRIAALVQGLQELNWSVGRNLRIDYRWSDGDPDHVRKNASELVALAPDVILASGGGAARAVQQASRSIPIVFAQVTDPVGGGLVASLAAPGGNATGFTQSEFGISGKWLELLKEVAPRTARVVIVRTPSNPAAIAQFAIIQALAPSFGVQLTPVNASNAGEIEHALTTVAREPNGGLIVVTGLSEMNIHRELIVGLAARLRLPGIYPYRFIAESGGLVSYGSDTFDPYRRAAAYVDRILKGEKPADLPVQAPTKYELVINLKTAKAMGIDIPPTLLARADDVIE